MVVILFSCIVCCIHLNFFLSLPPLHKQFHPLLTRFSDSEQHYRRRRRDIADDDDDYDDDASEIHYTDDAPLGAATTEDDDDDDDNNNNNDDGSSYMLSDGNKSYEDAGYQNEEDYLFDQFGGIGGTAEERAKLASALQGTLDVGPMADELFYEEVAMCFLRCRERHRMRTLREEIRERKKKMYYKNKRNKNNKGSKKKKGEGLSNKTKRRTATASAATTTTTETPWVEEQRGVGGGDGGPPTATFAEEEGDDDHLRERISRMNVGDGDGADSRPLRDRRRGTMYTPHGMSPDVTTLLSGLTFTDDEDDDNDDAHRSNNNNSTNKNNISASTKANRRTSTTAGVDSEHESPDDDDNDDNYFVPAPLKSSFNKARDNCNIDSDYEGVRRQTPRQQRLRGSMRGDDNQQQYDNNDTDDDDNDDEHGDHQYSNVDVMPNDDDLSAPSTPMSSSDDADDNEDEEVDDEDSFMKRTSNKPNTFHAPGGSEDDDDDGSLDNEPLDYHSKQQPHQQHNPPTTSAEGEAPVFRVNLSRPNGDLKKKPLRKSKYPPPPPPPPPKSTHSSRPSLETPLPMDVDDDPINKMARAARVAAEASAMKNDHESLRREFSIGLAAVPPPTETTSTTTSKQQRPSFPIGAGGKIRHHGLSVHADYLNSTATYAHGVPNNYLRSQDVDSPPTMIDVDDDDDDDDTYDNEETNAKREQVATLRDEGRTYYINGAYRDSVLCYTEAISVHTNGVHFVHLSSNITKNDLTLAALFGNRAAALMMTGAYSGASADCDRALSCTIPKADVINGTSSAAVYGTGCLESGPSFRSKIVCRMARALLKAGSIWEADKAFNSSIQSAREALTILQSASLAGLGMEGNEDVRSMEKILNQSITDATLGLTDVKRYRDAIENVKALEVGTGLSPAADRQNNVQVLMFINSALSISPGSMDLHERKVHTLASLKRWAELGNHCERLAAEIVKVDGLFKDDLAILDPFPDIRPARSLKADFFEKNPDDPLDPVSMRILTPTMVCDAVLRLPNGMLPLYLRSLRLEERYTEAAKAGATIEVNTSKVKGSRGQVPSAWLSDERDKLRRTMSWKEQGDTLFRNGDYEQAAERYGQCLTIDNGGLSYNPNAFENEDSGGRLHAVLHCNRAACLMALKRYREAVKECTAALRIHTHYMKAMLRRGRCFARVRQYEEAVAEYERYIQLVNDARRSPQNAANSNAACTFDRPIDTIDAEYLKAKQELADVKKSMRAADASEQATKKKQREQQFNFNKNFKAAANDAARRRQQNQDAPQTRESVYTRKKTWEAAGNNQRPWDTFGGTSPKKTSTKQKSAPSARSKPTMAGAGRNTAGPKGQYRSAPQQQQQQQQPVRITDASDHYQVLGLAPTATSSEIRKAYLKAAMKYHPDKNSEEGAADMFRRIKLANEVLSNDQTRASFDAHRRLNANRR